MTKRPKKSAPTPKGSKQRMLPTDRIAYSAIAERPPLKLPDGARLAVWVIVNVEEWDPTAADAAHRAHPAGRWLADAGRAELGLARIWKSGRLLALRRGVRQARDSGSAGDQRLGACGLSADRARGGRAQVGVHRPRLHPAQHADGEERTGRHPQNPRRDLASDWHRRHAAGSVPASPKPGKRPISWRKRATTIVADWVLDDQPVWLKTRGKPILNVPYTQECNDVAMMLIQHHPAYEYCDRALDQFEQTLRRRRGFGARHGAGRASLHHGRAAPAEIFPPRA